MESTQAPPENALMLMHSEIARQHRDALESLNTQAETAISIAATLRCGGSLLLLGMGASHYANRVAESAYRSRGVDTFAMPLSEALYAPPPVVPRTTLIASQSGESGEAIRYLQPPPAQTYGLTMNPHSTLARTVPSLIGAGGVERGFAATRSLMVTLALHGAVLEALGAAQHDLRTLLREAREPENALLSAALGLLVGVRCVIFSGRAELQGVAEVSALHAAELAQLPALALEGGQFRHGPLELLDGDVAVVLLRAAGPSSDLTEALVHVCLQAGSRVIVLDASGARPIVGALTFAFPALDGLAAAVALLPTLQQLLIGLAQTRVAHVGRPRRSSKVTGER